MLTGAALPFMLQIILSVSFISLVDGLTDDKALFIVMVCLGEVLMAVAYFTFGARNGINSVKVLVQHAKKRSLGTNDVKAQFKTGEYSAYKGFVIGLITCVPYILVQFIECVAHNSFTYFLLAYAFSWATGPFKELDLTPWLNFVMIALPVGIHGLAYIFSAHREWNKQQEVAQKQNYDGKKGKK